MRIFSEEHRKRISLSRIGKPLSLETRKRMREAHLGKPHPQKSMSEERKQQSREYLKLALAAVDKDFQRKQVSAYQKQRWKDPVFRAAMIEKIRNQNRFPTSEQTKQKISQKLKGRKHGPLSEVHKQKIRDTKKANPYHPTKTHIKRVRLANTGQKRSPETRKKISDALKGKSPTVQSRIAASKANAWRLRNKSPLEKVVRKSLQKLKVRFRSERLFGVYRADFYLLDHAIDLECDGTHWHSGSEAVAKDRKRDQYFQTLGIRVVRLTQKVIEKNPLLATKNALQKAGVPCG